MVQEGGKGRITVPSPAGTAAAPPATHQGQGGGEAWHRNSWDAPRKVPLGRAREALPCHGDRIEVSRTATKRRGGGSSEAKDQIPGRSQLLPPPEPSGMDTGLRHWSKTGVTFQRSKLLQGSTASRNIEYKQTLYLCKYFCKRLELGDTSWRSGAALHKLRNIFWTKMVNLTESMTQRT